MDLVFERPQLTHGPIHRGELLASVGDVALDAVGVVKDLVALPLSLLDRGRTAVVSRAFQISQANQPAALDRSP
ncbi:hypothetical protein AB0F91_43995 [Amycolatopsis sp. NPDC023774]|uniref:hypothetical protein n=1 Tax=Amycolatopsis sp. NPDC023774 TaxID=3155015 RepID=UPI0033D27662